MGFDAALGVMTFPNPSSYMLSKLLARLCSAVVNRRMLCKQVQPASTMCFAVMKAGEPLQAVECAFGDMAHGAVRIEWRWAHLSHCNSRLALAAGNAPGV